MDTTTKRPAFLADIPPETLRRHLIAWGLIAILATAGALGIFSTYFSIQHIEEIALVILLVTAILWVAEVIPLFVTSLLVLLLSMLWLLPELQLQNLPVQEDAFFLAFFGDITLLFLGGFTLSALLNKYGLANLLAQWVLRQTGTRPERVLLGIIAISALLSMWMSNTATAAMMFAMVAPVIRSLPPNSAFSKALAIGIPFSCNMGGLGTPIGTPPNAIAMDYLQTAGYDLSFLEWMLISFPIMLILLWLLWQMLLRIFPPEQDQALDLGETPSSKFSFQQKVVVGIFSLSVIGWLTGGVTGLSSGTVGLVILIAAFGTRLLNVFDFRNMSWDILFMLGGGLCLGVGLSASGLTNTIADIIPLEQNFWPAFAGMLLLAALMTTFMSNTATANLLIPIAISLPSNQLLLAVAISIMCSSAMAMPVSTPPNAIAFGSGLIVSCDLLRPGLIILVIGLLLTLLAAVVYFPLFT